MRQLFLVCYKNHRKQYNFTLLTGYIKIYLHLEDETIISGTKGEEVKERGMR
jgi:hypothetical protein